MSIKSIEEFKSAISSGGLQKGSHFAVNITCPFQAAPFGNNTTAFIRDVTMPGRNMMTTDIKYGTNLSEKKVNGSAYSPCTVTFMCDASLRLYKWFQTWQDRIQDPITGKISYPDTYEGTVEVKAISTDGGEAHNQKLVKAFPENVGDITFSSGDTEFATFSVTFAYRHYEIGGGGFTFSPQINAAVQNLMNVNLGINLGPIAINGVVGPTGFNGGASLGGGLGGFGISV